MWCLEVDSDGEDRRGRGRFAHFLERAADASVDDQNLPSLGGMQPCRLVDVDAKQALEGDVQRDRGRRELPTPRTGGLLERHGSAAEPELGERVVQSIGALGHREEPKQEGDRVQV